jgi:uncharacterized protein DUF6668
MVKGQTLDMTTMTSGLPHAVQGAASLPAGVVSPPPGEAMLGWRQEPMACRPEDQLWLLGAHGGAGVSTLRRCLEQAGILAADAGRAWPVPDGRPVLAVARTHGRGLACAQAVARQYLAGYAPPETALVGCVLVPDGPGKLPRQITTAARSLVFSVYAHTLSEPWAEEYRLLDPLQSTDWPPLPGEFAGLAGLVGTLLDAHKETA